MSGDYLIARGHQPNYQREFFSVLSESMFICFSLVLSNTCSFNEIYLNEIFNKPGESRAETLTARLICKSFTPICSYTLLKGG